MNIFKDPQYASLRIVAIIIAVVGIGYFALGAMRTSSLEQTGRVIETKRETVLKAGMKNNAEVKALQKLLTDQKLFAGKVDGNFGRDTEEAVKKFQKKYIFKPTGIFGGKWEIDDPKMPPPPPPPDEITVSDLDFNGDCLVSVIDLVYFLGAYGSSGSDLQADFDNDGVVGTTDMMILISWYGQSGGCTPMFLLGGVDYTDNSYDKKNDVWRTYDGINWTNISPNDPNSTTKWLPRSDMGTATSSTKLFVLGGVAMNNGEVQIVNDVWSSSDGSTWIQHPNANWSPRYNHSAVYFNGFWWVMGGHGGNGINDYKNDVWSSADGNTWQLVTESAQWSPRAGMNLVAYDGKMYLINGRGGPGIDYSEVWSSLNGSDWMLETDEIPFQGHSSQTSFVWNGKIYVLALPQDGWLTQSVWSSINGTTWTEEMTPPQPWDMRGNYVATGFLDELFLIGGGMGEYTQPGDNTWDIWKSTDVSNWSLVEDEPPFGRREQHKILKLE